ncbi:MAG: hypothetical protein L0H36_01430 [bacterium]|nr:hypothetical protein [bacterium]
MNPNSENILSREIIHHSQELADQASLIYGDQYPLSLLGFNQGDMLFSIYEANPALSRRRLSQYALKKLGLSQPDCGTRAIVSAESPQEKIIMYAHNDASKPPSSYLVDLFRLSAADHHVDDTDRRTILQDLPYRYMETSINNVTYKNIELAQHGEPILPVVERDSIYYSATDCARQIFGREPAVGESLRSSYELADRSVYTMSYEINLAESPVDKHSYVREPKIRLTYTELPDSTEALPRSVGLTITKQSNDVHIRSFIYDQDLSAPIINIGDPASIRELSAVTARLNSSLKYSLSAPSAPSTKTGPTNLIVRPAGVDFSVRQFIERQLSGS